MKSFLLRIPVVVILVSMVLPRTAAAQCEQIVPVLESVGHRYAPDKRTAVFDVSCSPSANGIILKGEVGDPQAKKDLLDAIHTQSGTRILDSILVLPDPLLGKKINGIIIPGIADVRRGPDPHQELLTQGLMGMVVKILKKEKNFFYVQMPDMYLGWLDAASLKLTDHAGAAEWKRAQKIIVTRFVSEITEQPQPCAPGIAEAVAGSVLKYSDVRNGWFSVELPDGRKGFVLDSNAADFDTWTKERVFTGENLEKTARALLGIHYLWGGTSVKGMDCSGFTKTVYRLNGMELQRDANQQAEQGRPVEPGRNFENLRTGDLVFFGPGKGSKNEHRITHVGMYLENGLFIHSSGRVRISSLDPKSKLFEESLLKRFVRARRLL